MNIPEIQICTLPVSKFLIGGNPFSGFSHLDSDMDSEMLRYYTISRIKKTLKQAEELGINTFLGRADSHIIRMLVEYHNEGGGIQWFAQTCPEMKSIEKSVEFAIKGGANACYIHGGVMDFLLSQNKLKEVFSAIEIIKKAGMPSGVAGHNTRIFEWAEQNLDVDFYMCSYYNAAHRDGRAEHVSGMTEWFIEEDRRIMTALIQQLSRPAIHYKVLAAGRNEPAQAFDCVARCMRENDAVCVGIYDEDHPGMLAEDVRLLEASLSAAPSGAEQGAGPVGWPSAGNAQGPANSRGLHRCRDRTPHRLRPIHRELVETQG